MHIIQRLSLPNNVPAQIEVWQLQLDFQIPMQNTDWMLLSESEQSQAQRFYARNDQVRSIATRVMLRKLLAEKLMVRPQELHLVINDHGKPALKGDIGIEFNVSHSGNFAFIALSSIGAIGIDIERYNHQLDVENLCKYVLTSSELGSRSYNIKAFIQQWVAKESALKALGVGIASHLQSISILSDDNGYYQVIHKKPEWEILKVWSISAPEGYAAALAIKF